MFPTANCHHAAHGLCRPAQTNCHPAAHRRDLLSRLRHHCSRGLTKYAFAPLCLGLIAPHAHAVEIKISAQALERTLSQQLFTGAQGRYYIRGDDHSPCYVYADQPKVTFVQDRIVVHVHSHAKLGGSVHGMCVGLSLSPEADVSVLPDAQSENIGFRDARVENLSESKELNFFLVPFLSHKLPQKMTVNMAEILRKLLTKSTESTGYEIKLDDLHIHSMQVIGDALVVDFDGVAAVH